MLTEKDIVTVNDRGGERGFDFQRVRVDDADVPGTFAVLGQATNRITPLGLTYRVALLSRRRTDSLVVDIKQWPQGIWADPKTAIGRAAWYSFAFFLRVAAADLLDADTLELDAGFRTFPRDERPAAQAFLCDKLENGAGYCTRLAEPNQFARLLAQADLAVQGSIAAKWLADGHMRDCDTSCNLCLRDFYNMPYHGLLDWRLGLDMARLAATGQAPDMTAAWGSLPNPWGRLIDLLPTILKRLEYDTDHPLTFGPLQGYVRPHNRPVQVRVLLVRHPLWTDHHLAYQQALNTAQRQYSQAQISHLNPFLAIRRPADYA